MLHHEAGALMVLHGISLAFSYGVCLLEVKL